MSRREFRCHSNPRACRATDVVTLLLRDIKKLKYKMTVLRNIRVKITSQKWY